MNYIGPDLKDWIYYDILPYFDNRWANPWKLLVYSHEIFFFSFFLKHIDDPV